MLINFEVLVSPPRLCLVPTMAFTGAESGLKGPEVSVPSAVGSVKAAVEVEPKADDVAGEIPSVQFEVEKPRKSRFLFSKKSSKGKIEVRCRFEALVRQSTPFR